MVQQENAVGVQGPTSAISQWDVEHICTCHIAQLQGSSLFRSVILSTITVLVERLCNTTVLLDD